MDVSLTRGGGGAANDCLIYVAKNGVVIPSSAQLATVATNVIVSISAFISDTATENDYFELYVANATTTNAITVVAAKMSVSE